MSDTKRTLKINPDLFKLNGKEKKKRNKTSRPKPVIDDENSSKVNKIKKELMKKVKDYQRNKEVENIKEEKRQEKLNNNLFEKNDFENSNFEREFNKSLNFLSDLAKKNKDKKKKKRATFKQNMPNINVQLDLPGNLRTDLIPEYSNPNLNYSCLKNSSRPTYSQLNKTQKNMEGNKPRVRFYIENNVYERPRIEKNTETVNEIMEKKLDNLNNFSSPNEEIKIKKPEVLEENKEVIEFQKSLNDLNKLADKAVEDNNIIELKNNSLNNSFEENVDENKLEITKEDKALVLKNIPKINRITRTLKYKVGKQKGKNRVGILVKNRETQKKIKHELGLLKQKSINEIKDDLRKKNLIKAGTDAPNDVLRKLYEDSILAGEVKNTNSNNLLHNFLTD